MSNMIVITIEAPGLVEAIKELAAALGGRKAEPTQPVTQNAAMSTQAIGQGTAPAAVPVAPAPTYSREQIMTAGAPQYNQFQRPPTQAVPVRPPTAVPSYTIEQISRAGAALLDAGKGEEVRGLLRQFGLQAVDQLTPDRYGAFATALRGLGARI